MQTTIKHTCLDHITVYASNNRYDPTRTTGLRDRFANDMKRRFAELVRDIRIAVVKNDVFGLAPGTYVVPGKKAFAFTRSSDKVGAFMDWLRNQVDTGILQTTTMTQVGNSVDAAWSNIYIQDSYKRGVIRARYEMGKAGIAVPDMESTGGIGASMATPFHADRVGLMYSRTFSELKGITSSMDAQISRVLAQGMADGDGAIILARKLVKTIIGGDLGITDSLGRFIPAQRRAVILARTEVIRAHHTAMVQEYKNWAVEGVVVKAEWKHSDDTRVCQLCSQLEGKVFTLGEIEGMIPRHPQCRCIALPTKQNHKTK